MDSVKEYYNLLYGNHKMNAQRQYPNEEFIRFFSKYLKQNPDSYVLELGCGLCSNIIPLLECNFKNVYGIDISEESIKLATERLCRKNMKANLILGDCTKYLFDSDMYFDAIADVFSMCCLNTNELKNLIEHIYNSLNDEGLFYSFYPSKNSVAFTNHEPSVLIDDSTLNGIYRKSSPYYGNYYNFRFMYPYEYKSLLENNGFEVVEMNTISRNHNMKETFEHISIIARKVNKNI
jgi:SAM-dependent methyltransferase